MDKEKRDEACKKIQSVKDELSAVADIVGDKMLIRLIEDYFDLDSKDARKLITLIDKLQYIGIPYYAILPIKFFTVVDINIKSNTKDFSRELRLEQELILTTIKKFQMLDDDEKLIALNHWPNEYHDYLLGNVEAKPDTNESKTISENVKDFTYEELALADAEADMEDEYAQLSSANKITYDILSKRWRLSKATIKKYTRPSISRKRSRLPRHKRAIK